jgi:ComF family protein
VASHDSQIRFPPLLGRLGHALLDVLYPPQCLGCRERLPDPDAPLCHRCAHRLERVTPTEVEERLVRLPETEVLSTCAVLWRFDAGGAVQRAQHCLKYGNRPRYGQALGRWMAAAYRDAGGTTDLILPIPLHRARYYERGYNQSTMLAEGVAQVLGQPCRDDVLRRPRVTRSQTHLSRSERWANVGAAFAVEASETVAGRHVLLVDDVLTTGATLAAAAAVLRQHGAVAVDALALALAGR